jgi:hypothetical protein
MLKYKTMRKDEIKRLDIIKSRIQAMRKHPVKNFFKIRKARRYIQALTEGGRDITTTTTTNRTAAGKEVDKNNYATYEAQVKGLIDMYEGTAEYGGELARGIVDMRTAFIAGEGISFTTKNAEAEKIISEFIRENKLRGSRLLQAVGTGEREGKNLMILSKDVKNKKMKVRSFSWNKNRYTLKVKNNDPEEIESIVYTVDGEEKTIPKERAVYVKLGGAEFSINETPNRIHVVLTDIENASRAKYDLRKNTHVFGKYMPYWKTESHEAADAINKDIESQSFEVGDGYAGMAAFSIVEPSGAASKAIIDDILIALKNISTSTGIPIHWFSWVELMSNRATADNLMEVIVAATKLERLIWQEAFEELFYKMLVYGVDAGFWKNSAIADDITVRLPAISIALLKQIIEVWQQLKFDDTISEFTYRNMIPGIDPVEEKKLVKKEKEDRMKDNPLLNGTVNAGLAQLQQGQQQNNNQGAENDNSGKNPGQ